MAFTLSTPVKLILQGTQGRGLKVIQAVSCGLDLHRQPLPASYDWSYQRM